MEDLEYIQSVYKLSKKELRIELMSQHERVKDLQAEIDTMNFVLQDASEDLISVSKAQYLIKEDRKKSVQYVNKCINDGKPYLG